jgi:hypothetical protein
MKRQAKEERYCGNCSSHNTYDYPDVVFCMSRYLRGEKATRPTLSTCDDWRTHVQKCFCVDDALKRQTKKK